MKKYEKPTLEVVQIRVQENLASNVKTTTYENMALGMATFGDGDVSTFG